MKDPIEKRKEELLEELDYRRHAFEQMMDRMVSDLQDMEDSFRAADEDREDAVDEDPADTEALSLVSEPDTEQNEEQQKLYEQYRRLLFQKEEYTREAHSWRRAYQREFGEQMLAIAAANIDCVMKKQLISECQRMIYRGEPVTAEFMADAYAALNEESARSLKQMAEDLEEARNARSVSEYTLVQVKKAYRQLAKKLHPDLCELSVSDKTLQMLWEETEKAYWRLDLERLQELLVLTEQALEDAGLETMPAAIPPEDLQELIDDTREEIRKILTTDPYLYKELLRDSEAVAEEHHDLAEKLEDLTEYLGELEELLQSFLDSADATLWHDV